MKNVAMALAFLLAAAPAKGNEPLPRYGNDFDCGYCAPMEFDRLVALLGDEVLRDMVCRLSSERYAFGTLSSALGVPEGQVLRRIETLRGWGLVRLLRHDSATTIVEPLPGSGAETLRRWAYNYCPRGHACRSSGPNPNVNERRVRKSSVGGDGVSISELPKPGRTPSYWPQAVAHLKKVDPVLARIIDDYPRQTLVGRGNAFVTLVRSIVGQQLSVKAAASIWEKLTSGLGAVTPKSLAAIPDEQLRTAGLSRQKVRYLRELTERFSTKRFDIKALAEVDDEAVITRLMNVKGVGRWTAEMFLIFYLQRPDVLPLADIGLQKAVARFYNDGKPLTKAELETIAEPWEPWRSVATWYLWRSLDPEPVAY